MKTKKIEERAKKIKPGNEDEKALSKNKRPGKVFDALRESEDRYHDLVENSQDLIYTHDLEGKLLSMNEAAVRITGYPLKDLLSMNLADLLVPEVRHLFKKYRSHTGKCWRCTMEKKDKRNGDAADLRKRAEEKIRADFHLRFAHSSGGK